MVKDTTTHVVWTIPKCYRVIRPFQTALAKVRNLQRLCPLLMEFPYTQEASNRTIISSTYGRGMRRKGKHGGHVLSSCTTDTVEKLFKSFKHNASEEVYEDMVGVHRAFRQLLMMIGATNTLDDSKCISLQILTAFQIGRNIASVDDENFHTWYEHSEIYYLQSKRRVIVLGHALQLLIDLLTETEYFELEESCDADADSDSDVERPSFTKAHLAIFPVFIVEALANGYRFAAKILFKEYINLGGGLTVLSYLVENQVISATEAFEIAIEHVKTYKKVTIPDLNNYMNSMDQDVIQIFLDQTIPSAEGRVLNTLVSRALETGSRFTVNDRAIHNCIELFTVPKDVCHIPDVIMFIDLFKRSMYLHRSLVKIVKLSPKFREFGCQVAANLTRSCSWVSKFLQRYDNVNLRSRTVVDPDEPPQRPLSEEYIIDSNDESELEAIFTDASDIDEDGEDLEYILPLPMDEEIKQIYNRSVHDGEPSNSHRRFEIPYTDETDDSIHIISESTFARNQRDDPSGNIFSSIAPTGNDNSNDNESNNDAHGFEIIGDRGFNNNIIQNDIVIPHESSGDIFSSILPVEESPNHVSVSNENYSTSLHSNHLETTLNSSPSRPARSAQVFSSVPYGDEDDDDLIPYSNLNLENSTDNIPNSPLPLDFSDSEDEITHSSVSTPQSARQISETPSLKKYAYIEESDDDLVLVGPTKSSSNSTSLRGRKRRRDSRDSLEQEKRTRWEFDV